MKLKAKFCVWHTTSDEAKPLVSMLQGYGIAYTQEYKENVADSEEHWVISEVDFSVPWAVCFRVPERFRTDQKFIQRLHKYCPLSEECDFE